MLVPSDISSQAVPERARVPTLEVGPGAFLFSGYLDAAAQRALLFDLLGILAVAPFFRPTMPRTNKPFSVRMTNCGPLGWVSDRAGYRYQERHPVTGFLWPPLPARLLDLWRDVGATPNTPLPNPEACLINMYDSDARMGLHQDRDETDFNVPVVSVSLGASAVFRLGGATRRGPTRSFHLHSGDVLVLSGASRLAFHGVDRILSGAARSFANLPPDAPVPADGRLNLTLRRVT